MGAGGYAFVPAGVEHQFRNDGTEPFSFMCIVPEEGDK
jgi:quercetin dioxygenase-like cupin family protein